MSHPPDSGSGTPPQMQPDARRADVPAEVSPATAPDPEVEGPHEALDRALSELRREIRTRFPVEPPAEAEPSGVDWFGLFDELRRRIRRVGVQDRLGEVDEFGGDDLALARLAPLLEFLRQRYWRVEVLGAEQLPAEGPVLFVANRSGLLPWDGLMLAHLVAGARPDGERPRFLVADWLVTLPFAQANLARLGGVRACRENAERLLRSGHSVVAFPEGAKGATKVFRERYRVQRFGRGGVVRLAIEMGVPIVPVAVVGAEEVHPILFKLETVARSAGLPFLPVTPTFPWLGPLGAIPLPSRWTVEFGKPLRIDSLGPEDAADRLLVSRLTEELRAEIQAMVDEGLRRRSAVFG